LEIAYGRRKKVQASFFGHFRNGEWDMRSDILLRIKERGRESLNRLTLKGRERRVRPIRPGFPKRGEKRNEIEVHKSST